MNHNPNPEQGPRIRAPHNPRWPLQVRRLALLMRAYRMRRRLASAHQLPSLGTAASQRQPSRPPVFVITAGWRSGSTAVQRLIVSGGDAFIWGEPFQTSRMVARLDRIARESTVADGATPRLISPDELGTVLADQWLATTNPDLGYMMAGLRDMVQTTYWAPLVESNFATWGVKEVTMTADQIQFLRALFPDAHFVGIVRNPVSAYASFRSFVVRGITPSGRPNSQPTWTGGPIKYARIWTEMARALREMADSENASVYRYEDINGCADFPETLGNALSMHLDPTAWSTRVGASKPASSSLLARAESRLVRQLTSAEAAQWGYQ